MRERGRPIILISHNLDHVFQVADRVLVMRGGRSVGTAKISETSQRDVLGMIVGSTDAQTRSHDAQSGARVSP